jgi:hypothetical protein
MGDRVRWQDKAGHFHRDLGDGNAEVTIGNLAFRRDAAGRSASGAGLPE